MRLLDAYFGQNLFFFSPQQIAKPLFRFLTRFLFFHTFVVLIHTVFSLSSHFFFLNASFRFIHTFHFFCRATGREDEEGRGAPRRAAHGDELQGYEAESPGGQGRPTGGVQVEKGAISLTLVLFCFSAYHVQYHMIRNAVCWVEVLVFLRGGKRSR